MANSALMEKTARAPRQPMMAAGAKPKQKEDFLTKLKNFRVEPGPGRKDILNFTNQELLKVKLIVFFLERSHPRILGTLCTFLQVR